VKGFVLAWAAATMVGEAVALVVTTALGASIAGGVGVPDSGGERATLYLAMVGAAAIEGAMVGAAQWMVARRRLADLSAAGWIGATSAGIIAGWVTGMVLSSIEPDAQPSSAVLLVLAAGHGALLGLLVGFPQMLALGAAGVVRTRRWLLASAVAWTAGMAVSGVGALLLPTGASDLASVLVTGAAGAVTGLVVGAVTGPVLFKLAGST
jgi:hypothetical protein